MCRYWHDKARACLRRVGRVAACALALFVGGLAPAAALTVVIDDNYPPYIFRTGEGKLDGYLVDWWRLWELRSGVPVRLEAMDWALAQQRFAAGEADVIDTVFRTPDRERSMLFSAPYATLPVSIYAHGDLGGITDVDALRGFLVGAKVGDACIDWLAARGVDNVQGFPSYSHVVEAAMQRKIRIFCMDEPPANYLLYRAGVHQEFRKAFSLYAGQFHRAVRFGNDDLLAQLKAGIGKIAPAQERALRDKWLGSELILLPWTRYLAHGVTAAVLLGVLVLIWIVMLRRAVRDRTTRLEEEQGRLRTLIDTLPDLVWLKNPEGIYLACNRKFERFFGASEAQILDKTDHDFVPKDLADFFREHDRKAIAVGGPSVNEEKVRYADDGHEELLETIKTPMFDPRGRLIGVLGIARDITQRRADEQRLARLNQLYRVLSHAGEAIARHKNEDALWQAICRILVDDGGLRMVWVGMPDEEASVLRPVAWAGWVEDFLERGPVSLRDDEHGGAPSSVAYREGRRDDARDLSQDARMAPWREAAARLGYRSATAFPLRTGAVVRAVITLYSDDTEFFDDEEIALLERLAVDVGLAMEAIEADHSLRQAAAVFHSTREGVVITALDGTIQAINPAFTEITGYAEAEVKGRNNRLLKSNHHDEAFYRQMWATITENGGWQGEIWNRRKSGEIYPIWMTISTVYNDAHRPLNYVGVFSDITRIKESEAVLKRLAHHDALTGLPNRLLLLSRIEHAVALANRNGARGAILFIDLDRFKDVNDSLGHPVGDELLVYVANRLQGRLREADTLARLGGDEFVVLLENIDSPDDAAMVAETLIEQLRQPCQLASGHALYLGCSIGISMYPDDSNDANQLIQFADTALYQSKSQGRGVFNFYTESMGATASRRMSLESALRRALAQDEFVLHFQPLMRLADACPIGVEALVRWRQPEGGLMPPDQFIPLAEETGLIVPLGAWVLRAACRQVQAWRQAGLIIQTLSVNLSPRQLSSDSFPDEVESVLAETGLPPELVQLELTEGALMDQAGSVSERLKRLKRIGIRLAVDDFGTGYSSLAYLKHYPIDKLKVDRSFVRDIPHDSADMEIAATVIAMAKNLHLNVLAEGIENREQMEFLLARGCDYGQGYYFSPPLPAVECQAWLVRAFAGMTPA